MATQPSSPKEAPRSEQPGREEMPATPDEAGPHDVPDDEVIDRTLPAGARRGGSEGAP
jgi:hypothetical protein